MLMQILEYWETVGMAAKWRQHDRNANREQSAAESQWRMPIWAKFAVIPIG